MESSEQDEIRTEAIEGVPQVPNRALSTYARLWQFETWLRQMIYVELRALLGNSWNVDLPKLGKSFESDKRLRHMPTPEQDELSYANLSALEKCIEKHWAAFECYLPPQNIWAAKLEEISQVRHRVAHFRLGHEDDLHRLKQLLRDLDRGFWRFCTSYNHNESALPADRDPVVLHFIDLDPFPWTEVGERKWARIGIAASTLLIAVSVEAIRRPWAARSEPFAGATGYLYDVHLNARNGRKFDYESFLMRTKAKHGPLVHICLSEFGNNIRLTIPAILGRDVVIEIIQQCLDAAEKALDTGRYRGGRIQDFANRWPEYVLGPENPLTFLDPGMECSFFAA